MICKRCGYDNEEGTSICKGCGAIAQRLATKPTDESLSARIKKLHTPFWRRARRGSRRHNADES